MYHIIWTLKRGRVDFEPVDAHDEWLLSRSYWLQVFERDPQLTPREFAQEELARNSYERKQDLRRRDALKLS